MQALFLFFSKTRWPRHQKQHLVIGAAVKVLLLVMAELGYCTLWFAAVLDGAAVLGTLLMAIRAFGFDKQHHRVRDYLPKIKSE